MFHVLVYWDLCFSLLGFGWVPPTVPKFDKSRSKMKQPIEVWRPNSSTVSSGEETSQTNNP